MRKILQLKIILNKLPAIKNCSSVPKNGDIKKSNIRKIYEKIVDVSELSILNPKIDFSFFNFSSLKNIIYNDLIRLI